METLIYFLLWGALIFLMMRFWLRRTHHGTRSRSA